MVRDGYLYGAALFAVAVIVWFSTRYASLTALPVLLGSFFLWFFRDPERRIPQEPGLIVSPGDGVVQEAEWIETTAGSRIRVTVFLSVLNVHVNRVPIGGTVTAVDYREGEFTNAMQSESAVVNEQTLIVIDNGAYSVSFKQIAGLLARRIVCNLKPGDQVERGQRMGLIKFGSRVDVLMPAEAALLVRVGDKVQGGSSVIGRLPESGQS